MINIHKTVRARNLISLINPNQSGEALADGVLPTLRENNSLTIDIRGAPPGLIISSFFSSFFQRIFDLDPELINIAKKIDWLTDFEFQGLAIDVALNFAQRVESDTLVPTYKFALTEELIKSCEGTEFDPNDFIPTLSEPDASGWDVRCAQPEGLNLKEGYYYKIPLGFRSFCPPGWWAELNPRSSTFIKRHLHSLYGKIDSAYADQWFFLCQFLPDSCTIQNANHPKRIEFGDRIGQVIPVKRVIMNVEAISNNEMDLIIKNRGAARKGGLGSTGVK